MRWAILVGCVLISACSTPSNLNYDSSKIAVAKQPARALVDLSDITDSRKHGPNWLGAIRGGFGEPLKTVTTEVPVKDVVKANFGEALKARGLVGSYSQYSMQVTIERLDCNQYVRREAHAQITASLVQKSSGRLVFQRQASADRVGSFNPFDSGLLASSEDLRKVANDVLQDVVDQVLDDPKLAILLR